MKFQNVYHYINFLPAVSHLNNAVITINNIALNINVVITANNHVHFF